MDFVIVTGLSGAGKSSVMNILEDIGYFCIDNMPPQMIPQLADNYIKEAGIKKLAIATDIRGGTMLFKLGDTLKELEKCALPAKLLFLTANREVLIKRYKETRRKHPLDEAANGDISKAIAAETDLISSIRAKADYIVDTSYMSSSQLKDTIVRLFLDNVSDSLVINVFSFGFKHGSAGEADLVFDVRCLPNPYYVPELKAKTGLDKAVSDYVMSFEQAQILRDKLFDLIGFLIPHYRFEGKSQLVIAFGCTGGKHRSVTFAELVGNFLKEQGYRVRISHRDIDH